MAKTQKRQVVGSHSSSPSSVPLLLTGLLIGLSWSFPLSEVGAALASLSFLALSYCAYSARLIPNTRGYRNILLAGMLSHLFGFYWIFGTIRQFGEFPLIGAGLVFLLFITLSSLQFPLFLFIYSYLPQALDKLSLRLPIAWIAVEIVAIRIFPWSAAHPLSPFPALLQLAEIGGIHGVSFAFLWCCSALVQGLLRRNWIALAASILLAGSIAGWGSERIAKVEQRVAQSVQVPVTLVQGNIQLSEKHDRTLVFANVRKYLQLSKVADKPGSLIVWPETVLMDWLPEAVGNSNNDRRLPKFENGASLLFGALSYRSETELFNSAFAIGPDGTIPLPYHKRILMPFGEFTPFADIFPYLRTLNNTGGDFTEGSGAPTVDIQLAHPNQRQEANTLRATPLICYEDVLPQIATEGAVSGAQVLINITNDAWFGKSIAPIQHHQIALLRAIETRRFLLRATNTGLTAIVSPTGHTLAQAPLFQESTLVGSITPLTEPTTYAKYSIEYYWQILSIIVSLSSMITFASTRRGGSLLVAGTHDRTVS